MDKRKKENGYSPARKVITRASRHSLPPSLRYTRHIRLLKATSLTINVHNHCSFNAGLDRAQFLYR